jgi:hypothetical protein
LPSQLGPNANSQQTLAPVAQILIFHEQGRSYGWSFGLNLLRVYYTFLRVYYLPLRVYYASFPRPRSATTLIKLKKLSAFLGLRHDGVETRSVRNATGIKQRENSMHCKTIVGDFP